MTGVPLKQVRQIIDAGLLGDAVKKHKGARVIAKHALLGLKLAGKTAEILSLEGRRRMVRHALDDPEAKMVRENDVAVDLRRLRNDVKRRINSLEKSKKMIVSDQEILGGTPCFKGTRIAVHDIAEMMANGDEAAEISSAYEVLSDEHMTAAAIYAEAYPRRDCRRRQRVWQEICWHTSIVVESDELPRES